MPYEKASGVSVLSCPFPPTVYVYRLYTYCVSVNFNNLLKNIMNKLALDKL